MNFQKQEGSKQDGSEDALDINLTPLIDIVFLPVTKKN